MKLARQLGLAYKVSTGVYGIKNPVPTADCGELQRVIVSYLHVSGGDISNIAYKNLDALTELRHLRDLTQSGDGSLIDIYFGSIGKSIREPSPD